MNRVGKLIRQKPRIATNLAQLEQGIEKDDLEVTAATRCDRLTHALVHCRAHGFVKVLLCGVQFDEMHQFSLRRQFLGDLILRATQNERRNTLFQHLIALNIAILFDRLAKAGVKGLLRAEKSGHQKFHQAPQLTKVILHRRAGKAEAVVRLEPAGRLRDLCPRVFDILRLIEDDQMIRES